MSYILIFLAVIVAGLVALFLIGSRRRELGKKPIRSELAHDLLDEGLSAPVPNLPPVLLPEHAGIDDLERVRFSLGLRGYRMDQVDQVLDRLGLELAAKDAQIEDLREQLATEQSANGQLTDVQLPLDQPVRPESLEDSP